MIAFRFSNERAKRFPGNCLDHVSGFPPCENWHRSFKVSLQHSMIPIKDIKESNIDSLYKWCCSLHWTPRKKPIEIYCLQFCQEFYCFTGFLYPMYCFVYSDHVFTFPLVDCSTHGTARLRVIITVYFYWFFSGCSVQGTKLVKFANL
jgi:hypothetical protein